MTERTEVRLAGCAPDPLGSYLKALGAFRVISEQADRQATGHWEGDKFAVTSSLDRDALLAFFLDRYRPTPLVAPWNRGSGLHEDSKSPKADATVAALEASEDPRLEDYRQAIRAARGVYQEARSAGWDEKKDKHLWVDRCRARLPDGAAEWIDVAALVLGDNSVVYPPLAGAGGVFGRLDISVTFMQRLLDVMGLREGRKAPRRDESGAWLRGALLGEPVRAVNASIGQFHPGASGGVGSSPFDDNRGAVNPWDIVLLLEGSLLFAASTARRHSADRERAAAFPFMVPSSPVGHATSAPDEQARGEVWAPLWSAPAGLAEIRHLLSEGRAQWRGRQARSGLDFAQAVAALGTDRGIDAFARHVIVQRFGQSDFAVPAGRMRVRSRREVPVVESLDAWLERIRRLTDIPSSLELARRHADEALFALAQAGGPTRMQQVLVAAADVEDALALGRELRRKSSPISGLKAADWVPLLDDQTIEFRLAAALASQHDAAPGRGLRSMLCPVRLDPGRWRWGWDEGPPVVPGLRQRPLPRVLVEVLHRLAIERQQEGSKRQSERAGVDHASDESSTMGDSREEQPGVDLWFRFSWRLRWPDADALAVGAVDDQRVATLLRAMLLLDWVQVSKMEPAGSTSRAQPGVTAYALLAPFFHGRPIKSPARSEGRPAEAVNLRPLPSWPSQLAANRVAMTCDSALRRLRIARLSPAPLSAPQIGSTAPDGERLAAALLCPITGFGAAELLKRTCPPAPADSERAEQADVPADEGASA